jgi:hypothetical protein
MDLSQSTTFFSSQALHDSQLQALSSFSLIQHGETYLTESKPSETENSDSVGLAKSCSCAAGDEAICVRCDDSE